MIEVYAEEVDRLQARIAELEGEVTEWKGKADLYRRHSSPTADREWETMEARIAKLEALLREYHDNYDIEDSRYDALFPAPLRRALTALSPEREG